MKVVCIGGGKGLSSTLSAWKNIGAEVTAIVATTDNGGSSGRLRKAGAPVAWGDLRKALFALAPSSRQETKALSQRYNGLGALEGHCAGNLMLEAFYQQSGSVSKAVGLMGKQLKCSGKVIPMTEEPVDLLAITKTGKSIKGETQIDLLSDMPFHLLLDRHVKAPKEAILALQQADVICIGPGSLLTSVMPVLLMEDIQKTIAKSEALKLFIHNISNEDGPCSMLPKTKIVEWLSTRCASASINSQLFDDRFINGNDMHKLPVKIEGKPADNNLHDVETLASAFTFVKSSLKKRIKPQKFCPMKRRVTIT